MPKQTVETYIGCSFDVASGTAEGEQGEMPMKLLVIKDGPVTMRFPMIEESAGKLADALRADGVVTAKSLPKMAVPKGQ